MFLRLVAYTTLNNKPETAGVSELFLYHHIQSTYTLIFTYKCHILLYTDRLVAKLSGKHILVNCNTYISYLRSILMTFNKAYSPSVIPVGVLGPSVSPLSLIPPTSFLKLHQLFNTEATTSDHNWNSSSFNMKLNLPKMHVF